MGRQGSRDTFWTWPLVLFPVTVQLLSCECVTYKQRETCGVKGSSVRFPCSYPKQFDTVSKLEWCRSLNKKPTPMREIPVYSSRMKYKWKCRSNDCTMTLTDSGKDDASVYSFKYIFRNTTGCYETCHGACGVLLHVLSCPVSIMVDRLVRTLDVPVADWRVMEGQRITLTCVPTCAANLTSSLDYIWYKDRLQLDGSRTYPSILALDPVGNKDAGRYACAMTGYIYLPSSAVNLIVREKGLTNETGSKTDIEPPQNLSASGNSTSVFTIPNILVLSVCIKLAVVALVVLVLLKLKNRNRRNRRCDEATPPHPNPDCYMGLELTAISTEYDTLNNVRLSSRDTVYENIYLPTDLTQ